MEEKIFEVMLLAMGPDGAQFINVKYIPAEVLQMYPAMVVQSMMSPLEDRVGIYGTWRCHTRLWSGGWYDL